MIQVCLSGVLGTRWPYATFTPFSDLPLLNLISSTILVVENTLTTFYEYVFILVVTSGHKVLDIGGEQAFQLLHSSNSLGLCDLLMPTFSDLSSEYNL